MEKEAQEEAEIAAKDKLGKDVAKAAEVAEAQEKLKKDSEKINPTHTTDELWTANLP